MSFSVEKATALIAAIGIVGCGRSRLVSVPLISMSCAWCGGSPRRGPSRGCLEAWAFAWKKAQSVVTVRGVQDRSAYWRRSGLLPKAITFPRSAAKALRACREAKKIEERRLADTSTNNCFLVCVALRVPRTATGTSLACDPCAPRITDRTRRNACSQAKYSSAAPSARRAKSRRAPQPEHVLARHHPSRST
jgi:hypothetical protein